MLPAVPSSTSSVSIRSAYRKRAKIDEDEDDGGGGGGDAPSFRPISASLKLLQSCN
ncbi:putative multidrug resistance protein [Iris pallida]|uniref:Multidrug resistance protein n=1 Tax=Iris pallida TaxID=29817 RepID=A0AAX6ED15_IRIPA|nr:putative multidrug resistance protein [Iris pallida]